MAIIVYNNTKEDYSSNPNNYYIGRPSILGNPYTDKPLKSTLAIYHVRNRDEAIARYDTYFDLQYKTNSQFKKIIDEIYEKYKNGEDIYLECFCKPLSCHGDIIKTKIERRFLKEKIKELKQKRNG